MDVKDQAEKTKRTAAALFGGSRPVEVPYRLWKAFDPELAKDLSLFITGNMYSREVLPLAQRQVVAVAALAALQCPDELKVHIHGALNVGVPPRVLAETIFQVGVYAGFPAVNTALAALRDVLRSRGEWPMPGDSSGWSD